ncbi:DUF6119 family protein, partial [Rhodoplanes sp. SY1]|uniref:DUF6119 family protein n=1 Tax=Rhodoplanes sp. SY1 TaxID=3166646 RepID=UPI0038B66354
MKSKKRKFSIYMGVKSATRNSIISSSFIEKVESGEASRLNPKHPDDADLDAYYHVSHPKTPRWMKLLSDTFEMPKFSRGNPASLVVLEVGGRIFAVTFGHGAKLLNEREIENNFGIKVAVNAVADDALKAIQKSNVASAIQQFAQSAFESRFGSFGGQNKFEILRRVSGSTEGNNGIDTIVGASGLSLTTTLKFSDIRSISERLLKLYESLAYKETAFAVIDDFKPVLATKEKDELNAMLLDNLRGPQSTFELCIPQINPD